MRETLLLSLMGHWKLKLLMNTLTNLLSKLEKEGDGSIQGSMNVIGKNSFNQIPRKIAEALNLPNPELFTGQAFRGTSLGIAAGKGANEQQLKQISEHTSVTALHVYIANNKISKENSANFTSVSEASKPIPCKQ